MSLESVFKEPIMVIGMHRSGTSLVTRLLVTCDIWMGWDLDTNYESRFFQTINKRLLRRQGEYFNYCPKTLDALGKKDVLQNWTVEVKDLISKQLWRQHFGLHWLLYTAKLIISGKKLAWGWKDPRTTLLFPLWKRIYPMARAIVVVRHPRNVCISLYYREWRRYEQKRQAGRTDLVFRFSLPQCFEVWKLYTQRSLEIARQYPHSSLLLRYEDLKTEESLQNLASFTGMPCNLAHLASMISYRPNRYESPPNIDQLERRLRSDSLVAELGYGEGFLSAHAPLSMSKTEV